LGVAGADSREIPLSPAHESLPLGLLSEHNPAPHSLARSSCDIRIAPGFANGTGWWSCAAWGERARRVRLPFVSFRLQKTCFWQNIHAGRKLFSFVAATFPTNPALLSLEAEP